MTSKLKVVDLFAGAGGISSGLKNAGLEVVAASDIDENCEKTYNANFPGVQYILKNVRKLSEKDIFEAAGTKKIDVVVGGPACQGFSIANSKTRSRDNPKNKLIFQFLRLVKKIKPEWFIMENVEGMVRMNGGSFKKAIMRRMEKQGYSVEFIPLCAADYGVPQRRRRAFFIGNRSGIEMGAPKPNFGSKVPYTSVDDALGDLPEIDIRSGGCESTDYDSKTKTEYQRKMRGRSKKVYNHIITRSGEMVLKRYARIPQGKNWSNLPERLKSNCVRKSGGHSYLYRRLDPARPANTIANFRKAMLIHPYQDRGLSVREAARLQSFPDRFVFRGGISSQQQQLANVVPPLLSEALGRQIKESQK